MRRIIKICKEGYGKEYGTSNPSKKRRCDICDCSSTTSYSFSAAWYLFANVSANISSNERST